MSSIHATLAMLAAILIGGYLAYSNIMEKLAEIAADQLNDHQQAMEALEAARRSVGVNAHELGGMILEIPERQSKSDG